MSILHPHFSTVFNNVKNITWSVLNNISQRRFKVEIAHGLTWEEFKGALRLLKNHTAPGLNGVTSEEIKALDEDLKKNYFKYYKNILTTKLTYLNGTGGT